MAGDANTPRKASVKLLAQQLEVLRLAAGIVVKTTRAYKRPSAPDGVRQTDVEKASGIAQADVSLFESGELVPDDARLDVALTTCGFDLAKPGGAALRELLRFLRDHGGDVGELENELPQ